MSDGLFDQRDLPAGFEYPPLFSRVVELGLVALDPWRILTDKPLRQARSGLLVRYPSAGYLPFARRQDNDDVACWVPGRGHEVVIVHDFASKGWEVTDTLPDFAAWLRRAIDDLIEFES